VRLPRSENVSFTEELQSISGNKCGILFEELEKNRYP
jgi:hypothetical protein